MNISSAQYIRRSSWVLLVPVCCCSSIHYPRDLLKGPAHHKLASMQPNIQADVEKIDCAEVQIEAAVNVNGLRAQKLRSLSPQEKRAETRLRWKIDLWILPLLALIYFLASMVACLPLW